MTLPCPTGSRDPSRDVFATAMEGGTPTVTGPSSEPCAPRARSLLVGSTRRRLLQGVGALTAATAFPHLWLPRQVQATAAFGTAKHLLYIRLNGGFRFSVAFNGDVAESFNPFGQASGVASGTEWGVGRVLGENAWLTEELATLGLRPVPTFANEIAVVSCVDHEPLSGSADGNHQSGLERFLTGYVGGETGLFTMINYGLRERQAADEAAGITRLPAIIMGDPGMGRGGGAYGAYRPAVLRGDDFERFATTPDGALPDWARTLATAYDERNLAGQNLAHMPLIDSYIRSREATRAYAEIFSSDILRVGDRSDEAHDGLSNADLALAFGDRGAGRDAHLALRLFHFGCPAVYLDEGGYDLHSDEELNLPTRIQGLSQLLSALEWSLKRLAHPEGGTYWDHTVIACGSEFSRTTHGSPFNSARGSDHSGDLATRWMSMPFMGGPVAARGRRIGGTDRSTFAATGPVFSYRSTAKTLMDVLGCDHAEFFPADLPYEDVFV